MLAGLFYFYKEEQEMSLENKSRAELIEIINKRNAIIEELQNKYDELKNKVQSVDVDKLQASFEEFEQQREEMKALTSQLRTMRAEMIDSMINIASTVNKLRQKL